MLGKRYRLPSPPTSVFTVAAFTAIVFFVLAFGGKVLEGYRLRRHIALLNAEIAKVERQQKDLEAQVEYAESPDYAEKVAREQFKWAKQGETIVIPIYRSGTVGGSMHDGSENAVVSQAEEGADYWSQWLSLFRNPLD